MEISVIICTYNRAELLAKALASMEQLDMPPDIVWELLVIDNNSSDSTRDVVMDYVRRDKLPIRHVFEPLQGLCYARNRGIDESQASIVAFTDDDALFEPHWLKALLGVFEQYDCEGVGGRVIANWDFPKPGWLADPSMEKFINGPIVSHDLGDISRPYMRPGMSVPVGANMVFRREVFERHGKFRLDLDRNGKSLLSGGDTEFCQRLLDHSEKLVYCADAIVYHPVEPRRATKEYFRRWMWGVGQSMGRMHPVLGEGRTLIGVPLWRYREIVQMTVKYLSYKTGLHPQRYTVELELIRYSGIIYEELMEWCRRKKQTDG